MGPGTLSGKKSVRRCGQENKESPRKQINLLPTPTISEHHKYWNTCVCAFLKMCFGQKLKGKCIKGFFFRSLDFLGFQEINLITNYF